jgi:hypothetical protein
MSDFADTPETYVAWRYLEVTDQLRPYDGERAEMLRGEEELDLLLAGTEYPLSPLLNLINFTLQSLISHRQSTTSNVSLSEHWSSDVPHNDHWLVPWSNIAAKISASLISKHDLTHTRILALRKRFDSTWQPYDGMKANLLN